MKKAFSFVLTAIAAVGLTGCGTAKTEVVSEAATEAVIEMTQEEAPEIETAEESTQETEEALEEGMLYESEYGYTITYDDTLFEVLNSEGSDCFQLLNQDLEKEVPVYLAVSKLDYSLEDAIDGLILQAGIDGLEAEDTTVGSEEYEAKYFSYESNDNENGPFYETFLAVQTDDGVFLLEVGYGDQVSQEVQDALNAMVESFHAELDTSANETDYSVFTNCSSQEVQEFAEGIQLDFSNEDWESLAGKISYPITVGDKTYQNEDEFAAEDFSGAFSEEFLTAIADTDTRNLFANAEGAMFGNGEIWFSELLDSAGNSQGLKIISI